MMNASIERNESILMTGERPVPEVRIRTNNVPREILNWWDLTPKEQKEFEYLDNEDKQGEASFVRFKGWTYDLGEFMACSGEQFPGWSGYQSDTFFSGVLVRYVDNFERVVMATFFS